MTITVTRLVAESLPQTPAQALAFAVDGIIIVLVIGLLVTRLLVQAAGPQHARTLRALDLALVPLAVVVAFFLYVRLQEILPLG
jgi:hypothetical protein